MYDTVMVVLLFVEVVLVSLLIAVAVSPESLESAYLYSTPDDSMAREEMRVKNPDPYLLKKECWYLERIEEARHAAAVR
jgi:hypothetical protein